MTGLLRTVRLPAAWLIVVAVIAVAPWWGLGAPSMRMVTLIAILALAVSGLNLSLGYTGELALGQVAVYAGGAYVTGYVATVVVNDVVISLVLSVAVALLLGIVTGVPGLRLGHWTLAITSFFLVLLIPSIVNAFGDTLGGLDGLQGIPYPAIFGHDLTRTGFYVCVVVVTAVWFALFRNLVVSRQGAAFLVLRESPVLAGSLGIPPYLTKLKVYALGAVPAGVAGCFAAYLDSFISPGSFGLDLVIVILAASILGGSTTVYGAIVGAAIMEIGPLQSAVFAQYATVAYGVFLLVGGLVLKNGLAGYVNRLVERVRRARSQEKQVLPGARLELADVEPATLRVEGISRSFGGVAAVREVSFTAAAGKITALIGPNGSGKTTVMNLVSGYYPVDSGRIVLGDTELSGLAAHQVARRGVGRSFQTPLIPGGLTVREVITSGRAGTRPVSMAHTALRLPRYRSVRDDDVAVADRIMGALALTGRAEQPASELALGTRRMLELGRAIAGGASLVLLDEVASGLDEEELEELITVLHQIRRAGVTVVLVEHNITLVRSVADHVVVLTEGAVLAAGTVAEIDANPDVLAGYLGDGAELSGTRAVDR